MNIIADAGIGAGLGVLGAMLGLALRRGHGRAKTASPRNNPSAVGAQPEIAPIAMPGPSNSPIPAAGSPIQSQPAAAPLPYHESGQAAQPNPVQERPAASSEPRAEARAELTADLNGTSKPFKLLAGENRIGRSDTCQICISQDTQMSREHAMIRVKGNEFMLCDLGSRNGTMLNGTVIDRNRTLQTGDKITVGSTTFRFQRR